MHETNEADKKSKRKIKMFIFYVSNQLECDCMLHDLAWRRRQWQWFGVCSLRFSTVDHIHNRIYTAQMIAHF